MCRCWSYCSVCAVVLPDVSCPCTIASDSYPKVAKPGGAVCVGTDRTLQDVMGISFPAGGLRGCSLHTLSFLILKPFL